LGDNAVGLEPAVGNEPARLAQGNPFDQGVEEAAGIWVSNAGDDTVSRIQQDGALVTTVPGVSDEPRGIVATLDGVIWVAAQNSDQLYRIDPDPDPASSGLAGTLGDPIDLGTDCDEPRTLALGFGSIWAACGGGTVARMDEKTGEVQGSIDDVGPDPEGIATDEQGVWVTSGGKTEDADGTVHFIDPDDVPANG
jgi:DNA-binding beta-propeller fold protein YncE